MNTERRAKMNDLMTLLYYLNREEAGSQRDMAQATNLSLGKINLILKRLDEQGYIEIERQGTRNHYQVTAKNCSTSCLAARSSLRTKRG